MRRHLVLAAAIAGLLIISGCGSDTSGTRRTVTAVVTVSSSAAASGSDAPASGSPAASSAAASPSPSAPASSSAAPPAAFVKIDPLKADCAAILSAADVKKIFKADIPNDRLKVAVAEVNADVGQTGKIRCFYGLSGDKKSGEFVLALTQYTDAASAQSQVDVTVQNESDNGAEIVPVTVNGYPATVALRDGGLLIMAYDNWTLGLATSSKLVDAKKLQDQLPPLSEAALTRILKGT